MTDRLWYGIRMNEFKRFVFFSFLLRQHYYITSTSIYFGLVVVPYTLTNKNKQRRMAEEDHGTPRSSHEQQQQYVQDTTINTTNAVDVTTTKGIQRDSPCGGDTSEDKRKRRREAWEKAKEAGRRFDLHRGLGNILRRADDLLVEVCVDAVYPTYACIS